VIADAVRSPASDRILLHGQRGDAPTSQCRAQSARNGYS
jgi:hypothetical protein